MIEKIKFQAVPGMTSESAGVSAGALAARIVDAFYKIYRTPPGFRVNHAKGVVVEGHFVPSPEAAALSRARLFDGPRVAVTVRFSNDGGLPTVADGAPDNPKGMAIKFHLPEGGEVDMVTLAVKFFPVASGEEFLDLLLAVGQSPAGAQRPTAFDRFTENHPSVLAAFTSAPTPDSFAHEQYHGINAFIFADQAWRRQAVRYIVEPEEAVHLTAAEAAARPPDFLIDDLLQRIAVKPLVFHLKVRIAALGDQTRDPSKPWPDNRKVVDLGVLTLDKPCADSLEAQKSLLFLPTRLIEGIELSDDALPLLRAEAYAISFSRSRSPDS